MTTYDEVLKEITEALLLSNQRLWNLEDNEDIASQLMDDGVLECEYIMRCADDGETLSVLRTGKSLSSETPVTSDMSAKEKELVEVLSERADLYCRVCDENGYDFFHKIDDLIYMKRWYVRPDFEKRVRDQKLQDLSPELQAEMKEKALAKLSDQEKQLLGLS